MLPQSARTWSAVSGTCKARATVSRLKASSRANPSAVSNAAKSKDERPIEALQWTATLPIIGFSKDGFLTA